MSKGFLCYTAQAWTVPLTPSLIDPVNSYSSFKTQLKCSFLHNALPVPPVASANTLKISIYHYRNYFMPC